MAGQIHKNDIGTVLRVQVTENGAPFNAMGATVKIMKLKKPSGEVVPHPATFETNGADGVVKYITVEGDLDESGPWQGQIYLEAPTGKWHSEMFSFQVGDNLEVNTTTAQPLTARVM